MLKLVADVDDAASCAGADWGDAPDSYGTLWSSNGAHHTISGPFMGAGVDAEVTGQPNATATGDDINPANADDEDGVTFTSSLAPGQPATIPIDMAASPAACTLSSWIDFNGNGVFDQPTELLSFTVGGTAPVLANGSVHTLTFNVPAGALGGTSYARFRCTSTTVGPVGPTGPAADGEVEDYAVSIDVNVNWDYGDLPDTFTTLATSNGARHVMSQGLYLGACVDGETTGVPSAPANGDDLATGAPIYGTTCSDDEDGVKLVTPLIPGNQACVVVTANNAVAGVLQGWIDFDGSGAFDAGEALTFTGGAVTASGYMRFRLSGGLGWSGPASRRRGRGLRAAAGLRRQLRLVRHEQQRQPGRTRKRWHQRRARDPDVGWAERRLRRRGQRDIYYLHGGGRRSGRPLPVLRPDAKYHGRCRRYLSA